MTALAFFLAIGGVMRGVADLHQSRLHRGAFLIIVAGALFAIGCALLPKGGAA